MLRLVGAALVASLVTTEVTAEPYPLDYWARRAAISSVSLSPDGSKFAISRIRERGGNPIIEVYDSDNLEKDPLKIDANPMEIVPGVSWIDDNQFLFSARQQVRDQIEGWNQGTYEGVNIRYDAAKGRLNKINQDFFSVVGRLPDKKNSILIRIQEGVPDGMQSGGRSIRYPSYYEYNIKTNRRKLVVRANANQQNISFDRDGNPILASGFDRRRGDSVSYWRPPGTKDWEEISRINEDSYESFRAVKPDPAAENHFFVYAHNGNDKLGLWSFDAVNKKFSELIYRRSDVDVGRVIIHSNRLANTDDVVGVEWCKDKCHREFFDASEEALYSQLKSIFFDAFEVYTISRSQDGGTLIVATAGPRDPGTYYLIRNGKISKIGGAKPYLEKEQLAKVTYINYPSRDGKTISGYVTTPNGEGPFPLVVMPHGGPYVGETIDAYDEWAQLLANNGYLVLQPQYRGSRKYGLEFYKAAFINGSEVGRAMQDDKDDGALFLAKEGLVDPDRMAMFGWSYGGYAALVAASREDQIYQCVIAGAAVTDPDMQLDYYRYRMDGSQKVEQYSWDTAISPIREVEKVNVPLLIVHGDVDQRVPPEHFEKYVDELDRAGISYKKLILEGADHFSNTLFYHHKLSLYESMLDFLQNDCALQADGASLARTVGAR